MGGTAAVLVFEELEIANEPRSRRIALVRTHGLERLWQRSGTHAYLPGRKAVGHPLTRQRTSAKISLSTEACRPREEPPTRGSRR